MAASKSYYGRSNYRFLPADRDGPIATDSMFELDESDIWNSVPSGSPEFHKPVMSSRLAKKSSSTKRSDAGKLAGGNASSLPVNIPDWSKILKQEYHDNRNRDSDDDVDDDEDGEDAGDRVPPHEFLARQFARTGISSFSVHEGIGRTLKGRDLSRVRNAIFAKTGFQD